MSEFTIKFEDDEPIDYSPNSLLIYAMTKIGKTDNTLRLKKALLLDIKAGAKLLKSYNGSKKFIPKSWQDLITMCNENKKAKDPLIFLVIDDISALSVLIEPYAKELYIANLTDKARAEGGFSKPGTATYNEAFEKLNLDQTPFMTGRNSLLVAYRKIMEIFKASFRKVIILGHPIRKSSEVESNIFDVAEIEMPKILKEEVLRYTDQLGILTRSKNTNTLDFSQAGDNMKLGGRIDFLEGKKLILSQKNDDDTISTFWERVFPDVYDISKEDVIKESKTWAAATSINTKLKDDVKKLNDDI